MLTAPGRLVAKTGEELAFDITIDSDGRAAGAQRDRHPRHARGRHLLARTALWHDSEWNLTPDEIGDLQAQAAETAQRVAPICASS